MPDQVTQVQPSSGDGGSGFGPGLMIGVVVVILIIIGAVMVYGFPGGNKTAAPQDNSYQAPAGGGDGLDVPSEIDVNVNTPQ